MSGGAAAAAAPGAGAAGGQAPRPNRDPFECPICMDSVTEPVVTQCGHMFCWGCLSVWLDTNPTCPVCKGSVTRERLIPVFGGADAPRGEHPAASAGSSSAAAPGAAAGPAGGASPPRARAARPQAHRARSPPRDAGRSPFGMGNQDFEFRMGFGMPFFPLPVFGMQFNGGQMTFDDDQKSKLFLYFGLLLLVALLLF
eukprot:Hpha_TRINITY_DN243_c0_g1::TRINITY_DN243_c0_g1_i1::g.83642::m.83642/K10666/RNF5; E3 ubiquitin-protein ligase RNF5